jgi:hypothetical protein
VFAQVRRDEGSLYPADLARLTQSTPALTSVVLDAFDQSTGKVACSGTFGMSWSPDFQRRHAPTDTGFTIRIGFSIQPAANGSGLVYAIGGIQGRELVQYLEGEVAAAAQLGPPETTTPPQPPSSEQPGAGSNTGNP